MDTILINHLTSRAKENIDFDSQDQLWKSGFESALVTLRNEMLLNAITFMPAEIHEEMIIERDNEFARWSIKKRLQWEVCRIDNSERFILLSTNNESIAIQQMERMREMHCYRAMCNAYQKYYKQI